MKLEYFLHSVTFLEHSAQVGAHDLRCMISILFPKMSWIDLRHPDHKGMKILWDFND